MLKTKKYPEVNIDPKDDDELLYAVQVNPEMPRPAAERSLSFQAQMWLPKDTSIPSAFADQPFSDMPSHKYRH